MDPASLQRAACGGEGAQSAPALGQRAPGWPDPDAQIISTESVRTLRAAIPVIRRAQALLGASYQVETDPHPEAGPAMPLRALHMPVFVVARRHWDAGHYRNAVGDAAEAVSKLTQRRLSRNDISGAKLMGEAFSDKAAEPGKPRLRCPGDPASETVRAQQDGAKLFAMGCFEALRDPAIHTSGDWNPVTAYEDLAALSIVSRWVTTWDVIRSVQILEPSETARTSSVSRSSPDRIASAAMRRPQREYSHRARDVVTQPSLAPGPNRARTRFSCRHPCRPKRRPDFRRRAHPLGSSAESRLADVRADRR